MTIVRHFQLLLIALLLLSSCATIQLNRMTTPTDQPQTCPKDLSAYWPTAGWCRAKPEQFRLASANLEKTSLFLQHHTQATSFLVIQNGYLVFERYYRNQDPLDSVHIWSVTKSISSMLIGIALEQGKIKSLEENLGGLLLQNTVLEKNPKNRQITIENLLTMTAGFDWNDSDDWVGWTHSRDWVTNLLNKSQISPPGKRFKYCTACSHLLSEIVSHITHTSTLDFAQKSLFDPLNIKTVQWDQAPNGVQAGGHGLHLQPRDMAKLGYLYLQKGKWENQQIISSDWIKRSTSTHKRISPWVGYGFQWWTFSDQQIDSFYASGYGGQSIWVTPEKNLVIVVTSTTEDTVDNINMPNLIYQRVLGVPVN